VSDPALDWIGAALTAARPRAVAALLRYFRDLDVAEEAFQEASLRALSKWPQQGPPRDTVAWLVLVARNSAVDGLRKRRGHSSLDAEDEATLTDPRSADSTLADRLDDEHYRDDILRLLFVCCHPELPANAQIALALRIVSGLSVGDIARAFLVSEAAMEQRITRAKARIGQSTVPFETPGAVERSERLGVVAAMVYLLFNEGYSASGGEAERRAALCAEAIRLSRLLLRLFPAEPEILGLTALLLLQHSRLRARMDDQGEIVPLEAQDRARWDRRAIDEGLALIDKALRHRQPGAYQVQAAIAALHARAATAADTDWHQIDRLYATLERIQPSPVVSLNRAVAIARTRGPGDALETLVPLADSLDGYFYFHGLRGALLQQLHREAEAREAFNRAIALAGSVQEATHIRAQLDTLGAC
jgi:RNA polymerase sigma-70 factor, ECF subfamily